MRNKLFSVTPLLSVIFTYNAVYFNDSVLGTPRLYNMPESSDTFFLAYSYKAVSIDPVNAEVIFEALAKDETPVMEVYRFIDSQKRGSIAVYWQMNCTYGTGCKNHGDASFMVPIGKVPCCDNRPHTVIISITSSYAGAKGSYAICDNDNTDPCDIGSMVGYFNGQGGGADGEPGPIPWGDTQGYTFGGVADSMFGIINSLKSDVSEMYIQTRVNVGDLTPYDVAFFRDPLTGRTPGLGDNCSLPMALGDPNACHRGNIVNFPKGPVFAGDPVYTLLPWAKNIMPSLSDPCNFRAYNSPGQGCASADGVFP